MQSAQSVKIDGQDYTFNYFSATKGTKLLARLVVAVGKPVTMLAMADEKQTDLTPVAMGVVKVLAEGLEPDAFDCLIKDILENTLVKGADGGMIPLSDLNYYDVHFAGKQMHLMRVVAETVKYQFRDFYEGLVGMLKKMVAKRLATQSPSTARKGSAGTSGVRSASA